MESNKMRSIAFVTIIKDSQEARAFFPPSLSALVLHWAV